MNGKFRELGHSGIMVSPIALGTWAVGGGPWWGATDDGESIAAARALAVVDSSQVKINGRDPDKLFYRAFLPLEKWSDRNERLVQPFELTVTNDFDRLVYIEQDWSGDELDPRLTPRDIEFARAEYFSAIHTCFIYASRSQKLKRLYEAMSKLKNTRIDSWYVFPTN